MKNRDYIFTTKISRDYLYFSAYVYVYTQTVFSYFVSYVTMYIQYIKKRLFVFLPVCLFTCTYAAIVRYHDDGSKE
jgi:hypothetical protein